MRVAAAIAGAALLLLVLFDGFSTVVLARRSEPLVRLTRLFFHLTWPGYSALGRRIRSGTSRESFLSAYGPLTIIVLLACWAAGLMLSFGLLQWAAGLQLGGVRQSFSSVLTFSGHSMLTMLIAEPNNPVSKALTVLETGIGYTFLGLVIGYLPVLYQSFSTRETRILLLDARAGSPPSAAVVLERQGGSRAHMQQLLSKWEQWSAELLQHQLSYPMLGYFRSQHENQSWLGTLTTALDASAVVSECSDGDLQEQAELTFAMGRHAIADLARLFGVRPGANAPDRLPPADFARLKERLPKGPPVDGSRLFADRLRHAREGYEPLAMALSTHFQMALPPWILPESKPDNWEESSIDREAPSFAVSDPFRENH